MPHDKTNAEVKVCHVTSSHPRYDVRIFRKECCSLAKAGYDITLLVNDCSEDEVVDGVKIVSTRFAPRSRFGRIILSTGRIRRLALSIDADIYHFHDTELLPTASMLKRKGKTVIFDFHEDVAQQILHKEWIPGFFRRTASGIYSRTESR
ncbi:MAG: glycosyltransferase, partial [Saccharofermentanales bacterium]